MSLTALRSDCDEQSCGGGVLPPFPLASAGLGDNASSTVTKSPTNVAFAIAGNPSPRACRRSFCPTVRSAISTSSACPSRRRRLGATSIRPLLSSCGNDSWIQNRKQRIGDSFPPWRIAGRSSTSPRRFRTAGLRRERCHPSCAVTSCPHPAWIWITFERAVERPGGQDMPVLARRARVAPLGARVNTTGRYRPVPTILDVVLGADDPPSLTWRRTAGPDSPIAVTSRCARAAVGRRRGARR